MSKLKETIKERAYQKAKGHRSRLKERFLTEGAEKFTDEDLLELLLMFGIPYKDTRLIARSLLNTYKTLDKVIDAPLEELIEFKGLGKKAVLPLKVVKEVARRYLKAKALKSICLRAPQEVYDYLRYEMKNLKKEVLKAIFLDASSKVISIETLFEGTVTETAVYPRELFLKAFNLGAVSIILVHNHPSGKLEPSSHDLSLTEKLILAGSMLHIKILDHIIIADSGYFSMAENGIIEELERKVRGLLK